MITKYKEYVDEAFKVVGKDIKYDPNDFNDIHIDTHLGKRGFQLRETSYKQHGVKIYSVYSAIDNKDENEITRQDIMKSLKAQSDYKISDDDLNKFLNRAAVLCYSGLKEKNIDIFMTPESSSNLTKLFVEHIIKRFPSSPKIFIGAIHKNTNIDEIDVDDSKIGEKNAISIKATINRMKLKNQFKIHNINPPQFRFFIRNWLKINDDIKNKLSGKNICIVDDYLTSGTTMVESIKQVMECGANNCFGLTILKGK